MSRQKIDKTKEWFIVRCMSGDEAASLIKNSFIPSLSESVLTRILTEYRIDLSVKEVSYILEVSRLKLRENPVGEFNISAPILTKRELVDRNRVFEQFLSDRKRRFLKTTRHIEGS
jgi:hypothetical protein